METHVFADLQFHKALFSLTNRNDKEAVRGPLRSEAERPTDAGLLLSQSSVLVDMNTCLTCAITYS